MPVVTPVQIPNPQTWSRALRRYDRDPRHPYLFSGYDCAVKAKPVEIEGTLAPTLFFPLGKEESAKRAAKLGWIDETDRVRAEGFKFVHLQGTALVDFLETLGWNEIRKLGKALGVVGTHERGALTALVVDLVDKRGGIRAIDCLHTEALAAEAVAP